MDTKNILEAAGTTLTEEAFHFSVDVKPVNKVHELLQKWKLQPTKRHFKMTPLTMGSAFRISKLVVKLEGIGEVVDAPTVIEAISKDGDKLCEAIAIAVKNTRSRPSKRLINFFTYNLTQKELKYLFSVMIQRTFGLEHFLTTIFLIKKVDLLTVKPTKEKSPQVPGESLEDLLNTSD